MWQKPRNVTKLKIVTLWHLEMSQNVTKCHTFSNIWYKATFTFCVWIRLGTTLTSLVCQTVCWPGGKWLKQCHWLLSRRRPGESEAIFPAITPMSRAATIMIIWPWHARRPSSHRTRVAGTRTKGLLRIVRQMLAWSLTLRSLSIHPVRTSFSIQWSHSRLSPLAPISTTGATFPLKYCHAQIRLCEFSQGRFVTIGFISSQ